MKDDKQDYIGSWLERNHVLVDEDEIVDHNEDHYSDKMWIYQFGAVHN